MNWSKLIKSSVLVCFCATLNAQNLYLDLKKSYPSYNEVLINDSQKYTISIENQKLKVISDDYYDSMILTENGILNNTESITYSELIKLNSYKAYTLTESDKKIKVENISDKQYNDSGIFYSNINEKQFHFPNLEKGSRKVYQFQTEFLDPFLLHKFIFGNGFPIKNSALEVKISK